MPAPHRLYVYAMIDAPIDAAHLAELTGITGESLHMISGPACWLVAGHLGANPPATRDSLTAQDAVVRLLAARSHALLPFRFGASFDDETALAQTLERLDADRVRAALSHVRGCEQMTLRLFQSAPPVPGVHSTVPANVEAEADLAAGSGAGLAYLQQRAAAARQTLQTAPQQTESQKETLRQQIHTLREQLDPFVRDEIIEPTRQAPPLIGSVYHLIARGQAARYAAIVSGWTPPADPIEMSPSQSPGESRSLTIRVSGPAPAYAFAKDALS